MSQALRIVPIGLALYASTWVGLAQSQEGASARDLIGKSTTAIGYEVGGGSTKVDLKPTAISPQATGEAKVKAQKGVSSIEVSVKGLAQPSNLGSELLTYGTAAGRQRNRRVEIVVSGEVIGSKIGG